MLPITVDAARRRLALLDGAGARHFAVYAALPSPDLAAAAGTRLRRLRQAEEIARAQLVFLAGVGEPTASQLRQVARGAGILLNVEDDIACSDFHSPAVARRTASSRPPGRERRKASHKRPELLMSKAWWFPAGKPGAAPAALPEVEICTINSG